jgi:hypothetical protein
MGSQEFDLAIQLWSVVLLRRDGDEYYEQIRHRSFWRGGNSRDPTRSRCDGDRLNSLHQDGPDYQTTSRTDDGATLGSLYGFVRELRRNVRYLQRRPGS